MLTPHPKHIELYYKWLYYFKHLKKLTAVQFLLIRNQMLIFLRQYQESDSNMPACQGADKTMEVK